MKARFETSKHDLVFGTGITSITIAKDWFPEFFLGQVLVIVGDGNIIKETMEVVNKVVVQGNGTISGHTAAHIVTYTPSTGVVTLENIGAAPES